MTRIGLKDYRRLPHWIRRHGLPAFLRRDPGHLRNTYCSSEELILAWELGRAKHYRKELMRKQDEKARSYCRLSGGRKD